MPHKHKVEDTRKRSFFKALTGNGLEIIFDTFIFGLAFRILGLSIPEAAGLGLALSVLTEVLCFITNYFNDRIWNRTQWGRKVKDEETKEKILWSCHQCLWRAYPGSFMICEHPITKERMKKHDRMCKTPCEYFEYDKTGMDYLERIKEGYSWVQTGK